MDLNKKRGRFERWLDLHNHKMELMRTSFSFIAAITGMLVLLKVFDFLPS